MLSEGDLVVKMTDLSKQADTLGYPVLVPKATGLRFLHNQRLGKVLMGVTPISGPVPMRAGGVIKPPSIAGGLSEAYAPGEPSAVWMCCTLSCAVLPITLLPVTIQKAQYSKIHP